MGKYLLLALFITNLTLTLLTLIISCIISYKKNWPSLLLYHGWLRLRPTESSWCQRASATWNFEHRHCLIIFCYFISILPKKTPNVIDDYYKLIKIINEARTMQYVSRIHNVDWSFRDLFGQCQSYFSNFLRVFTKIYEESFPLTKMIRYRNRLPWDLMA